MHTNVFSVLFKRTPNLSIIAFGKRKTSVKYENDQSCRWLVEKLFFPSRTTFIYVVKIKYLVIVFIIIYKFINIPLIQLLFSTYTLVLTTIYTTIY